MSNYACDIPDINPRRHFWTTQPNPCGNYESCGDACGIPGLLLQPLESSVTFATNDWVRSLLLNILNTVARKDPSNCGNRPGTQGGHWSESYGDGTYIGTHMYDTVAPSKSFKDAIKLLNAAVTKDAYKLVTYGVASSVTVETEYLGNNKVSVTVTFTGPYSGDPGRVNLVAKRLENEWVWQE